jgi:hypothetical protein
VILTLEALHWFLRQEGKGDDDDDDDDDDE